VSKTNCKIVKTQCNLTIIFASLLRCNKRERKVVAAGQKSIGRLRYHGSRDSPENSKLIEKKVSEKDVKSSKHKRFSPCFASPLFYKQREWTEAASGQKSVCGLRYHGSRDSPENSN
jgi:hypothetical protein